MAEIPHSESQPHHHRRHRAATTHHLSPPPSGVTPSEFHPLIPAIINFHTYTLTPEVNQCSSLLVQKIHAPRAAVWSILRRFDMPQLYKHFIKRCSVREGCKIAVGALRDVDVISGLPAATSTERLDILDDEGFVFGFSIIGGDHRLRNYRSVTTLHDLRGGNDSNGETETVVLESYVVDVPEGNTEEDTRLFADTVVKLNLQKLATAAVGVARDSHN